MEQPAPYLNEISVPSHYPVELIAAAIRDGLSVRGPSPETMADARVLAQDPNLDEILARAGVTRQAPRVAHPTRLRPSAQQ